MAHPRTTSKRGNFRHRRQYSAELNHRQTPTQVRRALRSGCRGEANTAFENTIPKACLVFPICQGCARRRAKRCVAGAKWQHVGMKRPLSIAAAALALALLGSAGQVAAADAPKPATGPQPFKLRAGGPGVDLPGDWQIGFDSVVSDSRCPKGVQCVWAGEATVRLWLRQGQGAKQTLTLGTQAGVARAAGLSDHQLQLLELAPYPVAGRSVALTDYVAILVLAPKSQAAAER